MIYYECILIQRRHYEASNLVACDRCKPFDGLIDVTDVSLLMGWLGLILTPSDTGKCVTCLQQLCFCDLLELQHFCNPHIRAYLSYIIPICPVEFHRFFHPTVASDLQKSRHMTPLSLAVTPPNRCSRGPVAKSRHSWMELAAGAGHNQSPHQESQTRKLCANLVRQEFGIENI